jgi:hypothetical protein
MSTPADARLSLTWAAIAGGAGALVAGLFKAVVFPSPAYNPPLLYPVLVAFGLAAPLWFWLRPPVARRPLLRGALVGAVAGVLTPALVWPLFLLVLGLEQNRVLEVWGWFPIYTALSVVRIGWATALLGAATGVGVALAQHRRLAPAGAPAK